MLEINEKTIECLQKIAEGILKSIGVVGKVVAKITESGGKEAVSINIETEEANLLIGRHGEHMLALQHLARVMFARQNNNEIVPFVIDVNNYRNEKAEYVTRMALGAGEKAKISRQSVALPPMSAYERRLVHVALAESSEVMTESEGEGEERCVIVKPKPKTISLEAQ